MDIANSIVHNRVTSVASCNSAGKTGISGCIVPWYLSCWEESIVVTTAPTWRQVKDLLWREINTRYEKAKVPLGGQPPNMVSWQISANWFAVGLSSKDPTKVQGYHADSGHLLAIVDEAAGVEELVFEGIDAILTSQDCRLLMLGNPTSQSGSFRNSFKPNSIANRIRIDAYETPNFVINGIKNEDDLIRAIETKQPLKTAYPQLVSPIWVYERIKKWGINSPLYQSRVRAKFPEAGVNNLIPLNWIDAACTNERLEKILGLNLPDGDDKQEAKNEATRKEALAKYIENQNTIQGVDVARFGDDSTVIQPRWGAIVGVADVYHKEDTMQTAGRVWSRLLNLPTEKVGVDVIGLGAGVVDRLRELQREQQALDNHQWSQILAVNVAVAATTASKVFKQMEFGNRRAELYWELRDMFEQGNIYLMPGKDGKPPEELIDELSSIEYIFSGNKIFIEEKKDMKKRLLKSPDRADALMLTLEYGSTSNWEKPEDGIARVSNDNKPVANPVFNSSGTYIDRDAPITSGIDHRY